MYDNTMRRIYDAVNVALLLAMIWMVQVNFDKLPSKIPVHFGIGGKPDGWAGRGNLLLFLFIAFGLTALLYMFIFLIPRFKKMTSLMNMPGKERILALPEEKQEPYWSLLKEYLAACAASINLIWFAILRGTVDVALGKSADLPGWALWTIALIVIVNVVYITRLVRLPKKLTEGDF